MNVKTKLLVSLWLLLQLAVFALFVNGRELPQDFHAYIKAEWSFFAGVYLQTVLLAFFLLPMLSQLANWQWRLFLACFLILTCSLLLVLSASISAIDAGQWWRVLVFEFEFALGLVAMQSLLAKYSNWQEFLSSLLIFVTAGVPLVFYALLEYAGVTLDGILYACPVWLARICINSETDVSFVMLLVFACVVLMANGFAWQQQRVKERAL